MISQCFRKHPELEASGKVTILGRSLCPPERMAAYVSRRNPDAPDVARMYVDKAARYGIRGDVAFCQAMYDTRGWTVAPQGPPWRPFAHTVWGSADLEWTASELERRTELHLRQLFAFVTENEGSVTCWEDLNGRWVIPGSRYGQDIVAIWRNMMEWKGEGDWMNESGESGNTREAVEETALTDMDHLKWLAERGWLPTPEPHPDRRVTWAELAGLVRRWEDAQK